MKVHRSKSAIPDSSAPARRDPGRSSAGLGLIDAGLAFLLFVAPLLFGGRHPIGALAVEIVVGLISIIWMVRRCFDTGSYWRWTGAELLLVAAAGVVALQLAPLPSEWLARLSPAISDLLSLPVSDSEADTAAIPWNRISLTPAATRGGLALFVVYGLLFLLLVQRLQSLADIERLLRGMAAASSFMAALGLAQYLFSNGKFLWVVEHPSRTTSDVVKGTFINENHFAHLLALGIGTLIWWIWRLVGAGSDEGGSWESDPGAPKRTDEARVTAGVGAGLVLFAGLLTFSRGGVVILLAAAFLGIVLLAARSLLQRTTALSLGGVLGATGLGLAVFGCQPLVDQLRTLEFSSLPQLAKALGREQIWTADVNAIREFPILGTGVGSHAEVYPMYFEGPSNVEYTHAESGYLNLVVETGFVGGALLLIGLALCARWCLRGLASRRSPAHVGCAVAVATGLAASTVHSVWDFVWYVPACMIFTICLAACACRLSQLASLGAEVHKSWGSWRVLGRAVACVAVTAIVVPMVWLESGPAFGSIPWDAYLLANHPSPAAVADEGAPADAPNAAESTDRSPDDQSQIIQHLQETVRRNPEHARAHLRLSAALLKTFDREQESADNAMPLTMLRDAAQSARFDSREALEQWTSAAVGENLQYLLDARHHAEQALRYCPLQGEAYVYLAELGFLSGETAESKDALIAQALRVRPQSGVVLLAAGSEALLEGDAERGLEYWRRAFAQGAEVQAMILDALRDRLPMETLLMEFQPDLATTRRLFAESGEFSGGESAKAIGQYLARLLEQQARMESADKAIDLWHDAQGVYYSLEDRASAARCAQAAVNLAPHDLYFRRTCAARLIENGQFDAALEHLTWCYRHQPHDARLKQQIDEVRRQSRAAVATDRRPSDDHNLPR